MSVIVEEVSLKDGISGPAKAASQELNALTKALQSAQDKMTVASAMGNIKAYRAASTDVSNLKAAISALPPVHENAGASASHTAAAMKELGDASQGASGNAAGLQAELAEVTGGLSIVAEAAAAVVAGFGLVVVAGAKMAIEANEAKAKMVSLFDALGEGKISGQATLTMLDQLGDQIGMTREKLAPLAQSFMAMGITGTEQLKGLTLAAASVNAMVDGGAEAFTKLYGQINAAAETGSKLTIPYKKFDAQLRAMRLNIGDVAKAMGTTEAKLTAGLKAGTVSAKDLAGALQQAATEKGAGPLARAGASLSNVWAKFTENIGKMFEDVDVTPFLDQIKDLFSIFDQSTESGQAMKAGIGGFFKEVFADAAKVVPLVKHFLLDLVIYGLKGYIALKPIVTWFRDLQKNQAVMAVVRQAFEGLKIAAVMVGIAIGAVVAIFAGLVAISLAVGAALWALVGTVVGFTVDSIAKLGEWVTDAKDAAINFASGLLDGILSGAAAIVNAVVGFTSSATATLTDWASGAVNAAKDFIAGLIEGITSGASAVVDAVGNIAGKAKDAFKSALGIHSPSTVMMELGDNVAGGVAVGMKAGTSDVADASTSMAKAVTAPMAAMPKINAPSLNGGGGLDLSKPFAPPAAPAPIVIPSEGGKGGGNTFHFGDIVINGAGKDVEEISEEALSLAFERAAMHAGVA